MLEKEVTVGDLLIIRHNGKETLVEVSTTLGGIMGRDVGGKIYMITLRGNEYVGE
jgi:hypothetical protein